MPRKKLWRLLTLLLVTLALACPLEARAAGNSIIVIPWSMRTCKLRTDCAAIHEMCGNNLTSVNYFNKQTVESIFTKARAKSGCQTDLSTKANADCVNGYCVIVPDSYGCLLRTYQDYCLVLCQQSSADRICQRACALDRNDPNCKPLGRQ